MRIWQAWVRVRAWGFVVGAVVTFACAEMYVSDVFEKTGLSLLNYKFKHYNRIIDSDDIVMIDINDYSLERVHRWPWPRVKHGQLITTLNELGARAILMDIVFDAPSGGRIDDPRLDPDADVDKPKEMLGDITIDTAIFDDAFFAEALSNAGNVYLAMFARLYAPRYSPDALRSRFYAALDQRSETTFNDLDGELRGVLEDFARKATSGGRQEEQLDPEQIFQELRIEHLLEKHQFTLMAKDVAKRLLIPEMDVEERFAAAKRIVARRLVRSFLSDHLDAEFDAVFEHFFPGRNPDDEFADKEDILQAYRAISSERHVFEKAIPVPSSLAKRIRNATDLTMPVEQLAEVAHVGLVAFEADPADGVMRKVPIAVNASGRLVKHIGFALASDVLDIDDSTIRIEDGEWLVMANTAGDRQWRFQVDSQGRTLINWHFDPQTPKWTNSFDHIPVMQIMQIAIQRDNIERAQKQIGIRRAKAVDLISPSSRNSYAKLVREWNDVLRRPRSDERSAKLTRLEEQIRSVDENCVATVIEYAPEIRKELANPSNLTDDDIKDYRRYVALDDEYLSGKLFAEVNAKNEEVRAEIQKALGELRPRIEGKICLVGYTAAAVADTVNSPVYDEMPGVLAHANLINSFLLNEFPRAEPQWVNVLLILVTGMTLTLVTTYRDLWISAASMILVMGMLLAVSFAVFFTWIAHIEILWALIAVLLSWAVVTAYRQLTEEQQKRAFSKSLAQYTSPAIAASIADANMDFSPRDGEVSCYFSDLKGFTTISEELGAERTKMILNPYLEAMSEVLIRRGAMINKFIGDAVFAFFNPPLLPCADHERACCEAVLDTILALEELKAPGRIPGLEEDLKRLSMRIGVNSGHCFVGDYGSENKLDYTCIGDTVNLAARLEPACKVFGITAMISDATRKPAGDGFVTRHLGGLQVVGKKKAVQVYELIGRRSEVANAVVEYAGMFGDAVLEFQERRWDDSLKLLKQCRACRPDDKAVDVLEASIRLYQETPPPDDWNRGIELTSK